MGKKTKIIANKRHLLRAKTKLKRSQKFARKLIEEKYISLSLKNKGLVDENATLLAQIETLKREKLEIYKNLIDLMPKQNKLNTNNVSTNLLSILETIKSDRNQMQELFAKSNAFYNEMIDRISGDIKQLIESNVNENIDRQNIESTTSSLNDNTNRKAQELYESRRQSFQRIEKLFHNNYTNLSVIEEQSHEITNDSKISQTFPKPELNLMFKTPERVDKSCEEEYEITPHFDSGGFGTPSIYNFKCDSLINKSGEMSNCMDRTSLSYQQLNSPQLTVHDLETTVTDEETNGISTSTPLYPIRKSAVNLNQRVSKRISSITRAFSPLTNRSSLINIQNVFDNRPNARNSHTKTITNSMVNNSNDTKSMNTTKRKRKKCNSQSITPESSVSSDISNQSTSYSRRNRLPVSYKEPPLNRKIRRGDNDWHKN